MRDFNAQRGSEAPKQLFKAHVPTDAIAILRIVKREELEPAVTRWQAKLMSTDPSYVKGRFLQAVYGYKLEQAQHEYDAACLVTDGAGNGLGMVVSEDQRPLLSTANILIYENLRDLNPPNLSGQELARNALITLTPLPPRPIHGLAA